MPSTGWLATAAAGLALVLASLELTAWLYSSYAEENLVRLSDPRVSASAELAARLAPWATAPAALHAWTMANGDRPAEAQAAYLRTLRWAPGDALVWAEYALALGRMGVFDERLTTATRRALELAPTSAAVHGSVANMGLAYWRNGNNPLRELWRLSLRWRLDRGRASLLREVEEHGYRLAFCLHHAAALGETAWCRGRD